MIDINAILNAAMQQALKPLQDRIDEMQRRQELMWNHLHTANERMLDLETRLNETPAPGATQFDEMYNNIKANVLADLEDQIEAGASKLLVKHLVLFNHDAIEAGARAFNTKVRQAIEAQPEIVQDLVSDQIDEAIEKHESDKHEGDDDDFQEMTMYNQTAERYARAVREIDSTDDPKLHMAGTLANLMILARNLAPDPTAWENTIDAFCDATQIKQVEGLMGKLMWTHADNEES